MQQVCCWMERSGAFSAREARGGLWFCFAPLRGAVVVAVVSAALLAR